MYWMIHWGCMAYNLFSWSNKNSKDMQKNSWMSFLSMRLNCVGVSDIDMREEGCSTQTTEPNWFDRTDYYVGLVGLDWLLWAASVVFEGSSQMSQNRIEDIDGIDKHDRLHHMPSTVFFLIHLTVFSVPPINIGCKNFPYCVPQLKTQEYLFDMTFFCSSFIRNKQSTHIYIHLCFWHDINKNYATSTLHWCHWQRWQELGNISIIYINDNTLSKIKLIVSHQDHFFPSELFHIYLLFGTSTCTLSNTSIESWSFELKKTVSALLSTRWDWLHKQSVDVGQFLGTQDSPQLFTKGGREL